MTKASLKTLVIAGLLAVAAAGGLMAHFVMGAGSVGDVTALDESSQTYLCENVGTDFSFDVQLNEGASKEDIQVFDSEGLDQYAEITTSGNKLTVNAPEEGYYEGCVYVVELGDKAKFEGKALRDAKSIVFTPGKIDDVEPGDICLSADVAGAIMGKVVQCIEAGDFESAEMYNRLLPEYPEGFDASMDEYDYLYSNAEQILNSYPQPDYKYYCLDMDKDGVSELLFLTGTCEADAEAVVIKYVNGKPENIGSIAVGHACLYHYPGLNGFVRVCGQMNCHSVDLITLEDGKIVTKTLSEGEGLFPFELGCKTILSGYEALNWDYSW